MAKRIKKSEVITKLAVDNRIARVHAQVVVALVFDAVVVAKERGQDSFSKSWIRETVRESTDISVKNLSAFDVLVG